MKEYVYIETFSDSIKLSNRKMLLDDFFEESCIELDDINYIVENKINKINVYIPLFDKISTNYYDKQGYPIKLITLINNRISQIEFFHKDDVVGSVNVEFEVENNEIRVSIRCNMSGLQKEVNVIGGCYFNGEVQELFNIKAKNVFSDEFVLVKEQFVEYTDFFVNILEDDCQILHLE